MNVVWLVWCSDIDHDWIHEMYKTEKGARELGIASAWALSTIHGVKLDQVWVESFNVFD